MKHLRVLRVGTRGEDVRYIQETLNQWGTNIEEDGRCGKHTYDALVAFHKKNKLQVGLNTRKALFPLVAVTVRWQGLRRATGKSSSVRSTHSTTHRMLALVLWLAFSTLAVRADVTIRYKNDYKLASFLPPTMMGQGLQWMPQFTSIQVKGNKGYSNYGKLIFLVDFGKQEITLVDAGNKRFATLPMKDYADKLGAAIRAVPPEAQRGMGSMKTNFSSRKTGRTDVIQGVQAEENETVLSMDMSEPMGPQPAGPLMKMVMRIWTAQAQEAMRVPAVRQWAGYTAYSNYLMDPLTVIQKISANMPGLGQGLASLLEERSKGLALKSHTEVYMPMMALLAQQTEKQGTPPAAGFDPNAAVMEMNSEIVELSTAPVEDSVFQLPDDYQSAPVEDLIKSLTAPPAVPSPSAPPSGSAPSGQAPQRIRVSGNLQAANLINKVEPVYPPLAEQSGIEGTVRFTVIVDKEGDVANIQLVSGHPLLVAAAQEAVRQWVYKPTLLNGQPIAVVTEVDVRFTRH